MEERPRLQALSRDPHVQVRLHVISACGNWDVEKEANDSELLGCWTFLRRGQYLKRDATAGGGFKYLFVYFQP